MKKTALLILLFTFVSTLFSPIKADDNWDKLKRFFSSNVKIEKETDKLLVLYSPEINKRVTLSFDFKEKADIYIDIVGEIRQRRGSNPFRVWIASETFWNDPERPKTVWKMFFRSIFLKNLRAPNY